MMPIHKHKRFTKELLLDPGFGFAVSGGLMFFASPFALAAYTISSVVIAGVKAMQVFEPSFVHKDNRFTRLIKDIRTPMRFLGLSLLVAAGATFGFNATDLSAASSSVGEFLVKGWTTTIIPTFVSIAYAICNFRFAADIDATAKGQTKTTKPKTKTQSVLSKVSKLLVKRPETYVALGSVVAGLLSGGAALLALPFAALAVGVSIRNIVKNEPAHTGHPNLHWAGMSSLISAVAFITGNPLLGIGFAMDTFYFIRIEGLTTPGGLGRVTADLKEGIDKLWDRLNGHANKSKTPPQKHASNLLQTGQQNWPHARTLSKKHLLVAKNLGTKNRNQYDNKKTPRSYL